jgi:outer membrane lipoprotein carrier protein
MKRDHRRARAAGLTLAVVLAAVPVVAGSARAQAPSTLLRCVQDRYGATRDLTAAFAQESRVSSLGRPRARTGRLFFQAPGRMRWEYDGPDPQVIVADGSQLWFYRPDRRQAVVQPLDAAFTRQTPLLFLLGRGDFAAEFTWEERALVPGGEGLVSVELRPRVEAPDLVRLVLEVVAGECRLAGTIVEDAFGNVTRLVFSGERTDTGLDAALFRFAPPKGTEVVRP